VAELEVGRLVEGRVQVGLRLGQPAGRLVEEVLARMGLVDRHLQPLLGHLPGGDPPHLPAVVVPRLAGRDRLAVLDVRLLEPPLGVVLVCSGDQFVV